jgi:hypothetical protein
MASVFGMASVFLNNAGSKERREILPNSPRARPTFMAHLEQGRAYAGRVF